MPRPIKEVTVVFQVYEGDTTPEQVIKEELEHLRKYKCISDPRFTRIKCWQIKKEDK